MRRIETAIVVFLLLVLPLAMVADAGQGATGMCDRACCCMRGHHMAMTGIMNSEHPGKAMLCQGMMPGKTKSCCMKSPDHSGFASWFAPLPPTVPVDFVMLLAPDMSRDHSPTLRQDAVAGYEFRPIRPPRS